MATLKVNKELWSNISEKKKKNIASDLKVKIVPNSDVPLPDPKDVVYGMTIREAAMLLAKEDKTELLARLKQDLEKEKFLKKSLKKRPYELPYLADAFSKKAKKERKDTKEIHLTKDEALLARKIEKELLGKAGGGVNAESMLYGRTVENITYTVMYNTSNRYYYKRSANCLYKCCERYDGYGNIIKCWLVDC